MRILTARIDGDGPADPSVAIKQLVNGIIENNAILKVFLHGNEIIIFLDKPINNIKGTYQIIEGFKMTILNTHTMIEIDKNKYYKIFYRQRHIPYVRTRKAK